MATFHEEQPKLCSFCLNIRSILLNIRSRTVVRAFEQHVMDLKEGGLSGRSREPCAPATFAMCLGITRATNLWAASRVVHSNQHSHNTWLLRRRQRLFLSFVGSLAATHRY